MKGRKAPFVKVGQNSGNRGQPSRGGSFCPSAKIEVQRGRSLFFSEEGEKKWQTKPGLHDEKKTRSKLKEKRMTTTKKGVRGYANYFNLKKINAFARLAGSSSWSTLGGFYRMS